MVPVRNWDTVPLPFVKDDQLGGAVIMLATGDLVIQGMPLLFLQEAVCVSLLPPYLLLICWAAV